MFDPKESEKFPDNKYSDRRIELLGPEETLKMGPIYQLSQAEEKLLGKYLDTVIKEGKIRPSSSTVRSPILVVPKPNGWGLHFCIDYRHLNDYLKKDRMPLPTMSQLQIRQNGATHITKDDLKTGVYQIQMPLGCEKYTVFRTKFGLYKHMIMPCGLCNAPTTFKREIQRILRPLQGIELFIKTDIRIDQDNGIFVVAYINDILRATKRSLEKHLDQVLQWIQSLMENYMCIEIDKYVIDAAETTFLR